MVRQKGVEGSADGRASSTKLAKLDLAPTNASSVVLSQESLDLGVGASAVRP